MSAPLFLRTTNLCSCRSSGTWQEYEKADRHYSSALQKASESNEHLPGTLLSAIFSNRSGARESLNRHSEALEDGKMALKHRHSCAHYASSYALLVLQTPSCMHAHCTVAHPPGLLLAHHRLRRALRRPRWPRAYSRIGAALISLRRLEEARENYEEGLRADAGAVELQAGLTEVLSRLGKSAAGSEEAAKAKARGNEAFKNGQTEEALSAYTEAIRAAPSDAALYSNRSAAFAKLERYSEGARGSC